MPVHRDGSVSGISGSLAPSRAHHLDGHPSAVRLAVAWAAMAVAATAAMAQETIKIGMPLRVAFVQRGVGDVQRTFADVARARSELGYAPSVPVEVGIPRFVDWYTREMAS